MSFHERIFLLALIIGICVNEKSRAQSSSQIDLRDTVVNNVRLKFDLITKQEFASYLERGGSSLVSTNGSYLLNYSNANKNLSNASSFCFSKRHDKSWQPILLMGFIKITVTDAAWFDVNKCVLSIAAIEGIDEHIQPKYYLVTIN